jgi:hypothetical protein
MRSYTLASFLLMLVCFAGGLALLLVIDHNGRHSIATASACVGLPPPNDGSVSLRGRVTKSTVHSSEVGFFVGLRLWLMRLSSARRLHAEENSGRLQARRIREHRDSSSPRRHAAVTRR